MQAIVGLDGVHTRTEHQVKGIAQQYLSANLIQGRRHQPFYRAIGAAGHKHRGLHHAMGEFKLASPG